LHTKIYTVGPLDEISLTIAQINKVYLLHLTIKAIRMKLTLRAICFTLALAPAFVWAQSLPNGDMENWTSLILSPTDSIPTGWDSPDVIASALGVSERVVEKETADVQSGDAAARLTTKELTAPPPIGTLTIPGTLAIGTIIFDPLTLETGVVGGLAMTERPEAMMGFYSYEPEGTDTATIRVVAYLDGNPIGEGVVQTDASTGGYQPFTATIGYATAEVPDTIQVIITSSSGLESASPGSTLLVDGMMFSGISSVDGLSEAGIKTTLYPNPTSDFLNVENPLNDAIMADVISLNGQRMATYQIESGLNQINVQNLPSGMYLIRLSNNGVPVYSGKFRVTQ
jgi:hypothetical protein